MEIKPIRMEETAATVVMVFHPRLELTAMLIIIIIIITARTLMEAEVAAVACWTHSASQRDACAPL